MGSVGAELPGSGKLSSVRVLPAPPRAIELYSIMPQASGNALPVVLRGMFLNDCAVHATQDVVTASE